HKPSRIRAAIEAAGARLMYLPPYSPDLNPIEMTFAKLKAALRKTAARSLEALWTAIADALTTLTPRDCVNFFPPAGYERVLAESALVRREAVEQAVAAGRLQCIEAAAARAVRGVPGLGGVVIAQADAVVMADHGRALGAFGPVAAGHVLVAHGEGA